MSVSEDRDVADHSTANQSSPNATARSRGGPPTGARPTLQPSAPFHVACRYPKSSNRMFSGSTPSESSMSMHALSIIGGPHR